MIITVNNAEEYLAARLSVCGELDKDEILARAPLTRARMRKAVKNLKDGRILKKYRYEDGRVFLRLSTVNSEEYMSSLSPALSGNAKQVVSADLKYSGSKAARMRYRNDYELYSRFIDGGIQINGIGIRYRQAEPFKKSTETRAQGISYFTAQGDAKPFEEIAGYIDGDYEGFLTKRMVKRKENGSIVKEGASQARIAGSLIINRTVFQVYAFNDPERSSWKKDSESLSASYIAGTIERQSRYYRERNARIETKALLFFPAAEKAEKLILGKDKGLRIDPCDIYRESYILPEYSVDKEMLYMITTPNWRQTFAEVLFPGSRKKGVEDTCLEDGTEVYNFIGCNLNHIRFVSARLEALDGKAILLTEEWMAPSMHKWFGKDSIEIVALGNDEIKLIAKNI